VAAMSPTTDHMAVPERRFRDLRAAQIVNLPTPRRRKWHCVWAVLAAAGAAFFAFLAVSDTPLYGLVAPIFALSAFGHRAEARQIAAQLRAPQTAPYASFDAPTEWQGRGGDALEGVAKVVVSGSGGLLETAVGLASKVTDGLWARTKPRQVARWQTAIAADLQDAERTLVSCPALLVPHGPRRMLLPLTLGLAWPLLVKRGFLTVTDQRLLFHRRARFGRGPRHLHTSAPLARLAVLEWHEGVYLEVRQHVLVMRGANGRVVRLNIDRVWAEEAQWVFDVVASRCARPPAFLAARWALAPDTAVPA
jgi:hypothetical protein